MYSSYGLHVRCLYCGSRLSYKGENTNVHANSYVVAAQWHPEISDPNLGPVNVTSRSLIGSWDMWNWRSWDGVVIRLCHRGLSMQSQVSLKERDRGGFIQTRQQFVTELEIRVMWPQTQECRCHWNRFPLRASGRGVALPLRASGRGVTLT